MVSHPLLDALIQPSRPLPAHFRAAGVGMPKALPRLLRFGPVAPPQVGGSQFTGGRVSQPQTSLVHPEAAQGFTPPAYSPGNATAPSLAPFVLTPQGGAPTGPPFNMAGGGQTGATAPPRPSPTPGADASALGQPQSPMGATGATAPPTQGGLSTGGYSDVAQLIASHLGIGAPLDTAVQAATWTPSNTMTVDAALRAALAAQQGQKLNPSGGTLLKPTAGNLAGNVRYFS